MRRIVVLVAASLVLVGVLPSPALGAPPRRVTYRPPVDAPIVDAFRAPAERWGAGNRGLEYATGSGDPVSAAAEGVVAFAGQVGGQLHVVVLHADGLRTTYAFLRSVEVRRGDVVGQGRQLGTSGDTVHFGARIGEIYVDPALLFGDGRPEVHLVPEHDQGVGTEAQERVGLFGQLLAFGGRAAEWAIDWAAGKYDDTLAEALGAAHYLQEAGPISHVARLGAAGVEWVRQRHDCTPEGFPTPRLNERHLAVLVGGLGSSSRNAAIDDLDTSALGYRDGDVSRFSYRGASTDVMPYGPDDTTADIRHSARLLREYLQARAAEHPGVPIDVIAHSQGGIVARESLTNEFDVLDPTRPQVSSLVTLGSPHQGADLATAGAMFGATRLGQATERLAALALPWDPHSTSVEQLSESSSFIRDLNRRPLPDGLHATSIGARGDLMVPAGRTPFSDAEDVVVSVPGVVTDHDLLPGSDQGRREVALAVNRMKPTCQGLADAMADAIVSDHVGMAEDAIGIGAWSGGRKVDSYIPSPLDLWRRRRGTS